MPGYVTHYISGVNAYKKLSKSDVRDIIKNNRSAYCLGLQGPDLFFYFMPSSLGIKPNIANLLHKEKTGLFFNNLIREIALVRGNASFETLVSYICGFMGHYLLDTLLHPYVYSRVGISLSQKTLGMHFGLETDMDRELLFHFKHMRPTDFMHSSVINLNVREINDIADLLKKTIKSTYDLDITEKYVKAAIVSFRIETSLLPDERLIKHKTINFIERHTLGYDIVSPLLINDISHVDDPCNLNHTKWKNPWDDNHSSTESVYDILERTDKLLSEYIPLMYDALYSSYHLIGTKNPEIITLLGNNSYSSGLDCTNPLKRTK